MTKNSEFFAKIKLRNNTKKTGFSQEHPDVSTSGRPTGFRFPSTSVCVCVCMCVCVLMYVCPARWTNVCIHENVLHAHLMIVVYRDRFENRLRCQRTGQNERYYMKTTLA